jgi:hypothetical protein
LLVRSGGSSSSSGSETGFRLAGDYEASETEAAAETVLVAGDARSLKSGGMTDAKPAREEHGLCSADGTLCSKAADQQRK